MIYSFNGQFHFLSNFYPIAIWYDGVTYSSVEHAYQAMKTEDLMTRLFIANAKHAAEAKKMGQKVVLRPDWEEVKIPIMRELLFLKFTQEPVKTWLLDTGEEKLVEGNYWGDTFWGVCRGEGENHLGKLLMEVRNQIKE